MFVLPSRTSKMVKSHEVSNKNFKNRTADNVLKIQSSQNDYPGSSSAKPHNVDNAEMNETIILLK